MNYLSLASSPQTFILLFLSSSCFLSACPPGHTQKFTRRSVVLDDCWNPFFEPVPPGHILFKAESRALEKSRAEAASRLQIRFVVCYYAVSCKWWHHRSALYWKECIKIGIWRGDLVVLACLGASNERAFTHISIQWVHFGCGKGTRGGGGRTGKENWDIMATWALPSRVLEASRVLASYSPHMVTIYCIEQQLFLSVVWLCRGNMRFWFVACTETLEMDWCW